MGGVAREVETKLQVPEGFVVPDLGALDGLASVVVRPSLALRAVYWDTADLRLAQAGISLRHRTGEGDPRWTLKLPDRGDGSSLDRDEHHVPGGPRTVPAVLRSLVAARVRRGLLAPVATLRTERAVRHLVDPDGVAFAELVDDDVTVLDGRQLLLRFRELEVELLRQSGAARAAAHAAIDRLVAAGATRAEQTSKVKRALSARGPVPVALAVPELGKHSTAADVVTAALRGGQAKLVAADLDLRLGADDAVHQLRVACRRLRSDLRSAAPLLDDPRVDDLRTELAWLAGELGQARDLEVLRARVRRTAALDPVDRLDAAALERIDALLAAQEADGVAHAVAAIASERYLDLLELLAETAARPRVTDGDDRTAKQVETDLVARAWRRLRKRVERLDPLDPDDPWHRTRIAAKQARYAAEGAVEVSGRPARRTAKVAAALQELLGEHQDAAVAAERVLALAAADPDDLALVVTCARLAERERAVTRELRTQLPALWEKGVARAGWLRTR